MDLFDKCRAYTAAKEVMAAGYYPYFRQITSAQEPEVIVNGRKMIMIGSNNYLGLTTHPKIKEAAIKAVKKYGTGCAGSRFLNGTLDLHEEVEKKIALFKGKEAALLFSTGFLTNLGAIAALVAKEDVVITDRLDHASIVDGCRLSFGQTRKFRHNDMKDLARLLRLDRARGKLIVVDGVFSMEGDIADLPTIVRLSKEYGARIMVDDAHATGVLGKNGRGTAEHFGLEDRVDIIMGTCSKSLASIGGFIAGSEEVIHYVKHHARALIFSASLPPSAVATIGAAIDVINKEPERRERLWENTRKMKKGFQALGFDTGSSETPIIPIVVGDDFRAFQMWKLLAENDIFANVAVSPAVPSGRALIRTSYMATHTNAQLDRVLDVFEKVGKKLGII
ncbi:MAG: aminotransferase class I/II-fold pyridoxal phosphate-dependent enzyme [candidate division NC10 bacterium]|nr:aminotransferase class I/II-fold pyridoxal phosphate-dependent enzyme [candidate division NC10 bacterium]